MLFLWLQQVYLSIVVVHFAKCAKRIDVKKRMAEGLKKRQLKERHNDGNCERNHSEKLKSFFKNCLIRYSKMVIGAFCFLFHNRFSDFFQKNFSPSL